jgi:hypothetical protein
MTAARRSKALAAWTKLDGPSVARPPESSHHAEGIQSPYPRCPVPHGRDRPDLHAGCRQPGRAAAHGPGPAARRADGRPDVRRAGERDLDRSGSLVRETGFLGMAAQRPARFAARRYVLESAGRRAVRALCGPGG